MSVCDSCDSTVSTGYSDWTQIYYQVYGLAFTSMKSIAYVTIPGEWNIFTVAFTSNGAIDCTEERLVIELPVSNTNLAAQQILFAVDGGLGNFICTI